MTRVPILMYHQVAPETAPAFYKYCVTPDAFRAQIHWLSRSGYTTIDLDTLLERRAGRAPLPLKPVVITFDDGFRDCVDHAAPILAEYGMTATMFLVAGLMGKRSAWLQRERGVDFPLLDWPAARQLDASGVRCESHTVSHPHLADLDASSCRHELLAAREILEQGLGRRITHLAYPFGSVSERVRQLAAECGYRSACTTRIGLSPPEDDALELHRVPVVGNDTLLAFVTRLHTAHSPFELIRGKVAAAAGLLQRQG